MRHHVSMPYQLCGYHGYNWSETAVKFLLWLIVSNYQKKLFIAHEFVMSNHKTHKS